MSEPDQGLNQRFRSGDDDAVRTLVERHMEILVRQLAGRIPPALRRRIALADVIQETCITAYRRRGDFEDRGPEAFGRWIAGIARNKLLHALRDHGVTAKRAVSREVTPDDGADANRFHAPTETPSVVAVSAERVGRVREAMGSLSDDHRTVLELALEKGLSLGEVAERMGRTREAVKKLYARALCRLRLAVGSIDGA